MSTEVIHEIDKHRYVIFEGSVEAGYLEYEDRETNRLFTHTLVYPAFRGGGIASILVRQGLADTVTTSDQNIVSGCSYVTTWLDRHPDFLEETRASIDPELGYSCRIVRD